jgi:hypothetical protein
MRTLRLARIAAQAEGIRLRHIARRTAFRVAYVFFGLIFLFGVLVMGHVALFMWLAEHLRPVICALILLGADLVVAIILFLMALMAGPGRLEREAKAIRDQASSQVADIASTALLMRPLLRLLSNRQIYGAILAALTARFMSSSRR